MGNEPDDDEEVARIRSKVEQAFQPPAPRPPKNALYLGWDPVTREPVYILPRDLNVHQHVIGGSRSGKTNALKREVHLLIKRKLKRGEGFSMVDPHGELAPYALELCVRMGVDPEDVISLTLKESEYVLSMNPVRPVTDDPYFQAACVTEALIKVFDQSRAQDKPLVNRMMKNMALAQMAARLSLIESRFFLYRGAETEPVLSQIVDALPAGDCRSFWQSFLAKGIREAELDAMGPANRLDDLIRPKVFRRILGQERLSFDALEVMDRAYIGLFDTSIGRNTEITADGQALFNALIVQQYRQAFPRRTPKGDRHYDRKSTPPHTLILDEFGSYCTPEFAKVLTEASKFGLRCVFSHQNMQQLVGKDGDKTLYNAVLAIPNKIVFGNLPFDEAEELARHMHLKDLDPDQIKYQGETVQWDPVVTWGKTAETVTWSETVTREPRRRSVVQDPGSRGSSSSTSRDSVSGREVDQTGTSEQAAREIQSVTWPEGPTVARQTGGSVTHGYHTKYTKRIKKDTPVFRSVEEQVFLAAQVISTNPQGVSVSAVEWREPLLCQFPNMDERPVSEKELGAYARLMIQKQIYGRTVDVDREYDARQARLLAQAKPVEKQLPRGKPPATGKGKKKPAKAKSKLPS